MAKVPAITRTLARALRELRDFEYDPDLEEVIELLLEAKDKLSEVMEYGEQDHQDDDDGERDGQAAPG
jgi:chemotaxis regulatin CheY-phosphate phosphatase CheZ